MSDKHMLKIVVFLCCFILANAPLPIYAEYRVVAKPYWEDPDYGKLSISDLESKTTAELRLLRNGIYARHGKVFSSKDLKEYFSRKGWYKPNSAFHELMLTDNEAVWVERIRDVEDSIVSKQYVKSVTFCGRNASREVDMDGDGRPENIVITPVDDTTINISVDSTTLMEGGPGCSVALVDIDNADGNKELLVSDEGPSDDYTTRVYLFRKGKLEKIGLVGGKPSSNYLTTNGKGILKARERGKILHTWFYYQDYKFGPEHKLVPVPQQYIQMNTRVVMAKELVLCSAPDSAMPNGTLKVGEHAVILRTDDKKLLEILGESGVRGWARFSSAYEINGVSAADYFDGLSFAD